MNIHKSIKKKTNFHIIFYHSYYSEMLLLVCLCRTLMAANDRNPCWFDLNEISNSCKAPNRLRTADVRMVGIQKIRVSEISLTPLLVVTPWLSPHPHHTVCPSMTPHPLQFHPLFMKTVPGSFQGQLAFLSSCWSICGSAHVVRSHSPGITWLLRFSLKWE